MSNKSSDKEASPKIKEASPKIKEASPKTKEASSRTSGQHFTPADERSETASNSDNPRQAKHFMPTPEECLAEAPETITAGERLPHISEYSGIQLDALPIKGLRSFVVISLMLFAVLLGWDIYDLFRQTLEIHWIIASAFVGLIILVGALGIRLLWRYTRDRENLETLNRLKTEAQRLTTANDFGDADAFIQQLQKFYANKPQALFYQRCLEQLPDYSNDREIIEHIERVFIQSLDKEAMRRVSAFSLQTGAAVAISPWASLDMLLSLWRNLKMIDDIAQVYGVRPSLHNRYKLLKQVLHQLIFVGASDVAIDQLMNEFGTATFTSIASSRIGQGLGAGIYTARIGIAAMAVSRPIEFNSVNKPQVKALISPMINHLKNLIKPSNTVD
ncbi:TIGR01620 family protein [Amphritea sp. 1_MG-2023]|uniref:TIGR01620 family protein n=1 Tax=Amphritea sp. 1_MG-2023 TaxID=3062670 RepID=UPI0026E301E5|nr:TIGR01620 family protein [Amphritea sp. 1_MG-2023]MDO6564639.1 TIGR01620 family protein [Amphritea sp. 1_MG-2023]